MSGRLETTMHGMLDMRLSFVAVLMQIHAAVCLTYSLIEFLLYLFDLVVCISFLALLFVWDLRLLPALASAKPASWRHPPAVVVCFLSLVWSVVVVVTCLSARRSVPGLSLGWVLPWAPFLLPLVSDPWARDLSALVVASSRLAKKPGVVRQPP